jgi:hypothetical protein
MTITWFVSIIGVWGFLAIWPPIRHPLGALMAEHGLPPPRQT